MSNYFICVGGTGSRIGEAFVYLCASGYFGQGKTQIWIVDKDTQCANGSILHSAVNEYNDVRQNCMWQDAPCFSQELSLNEWNFEDALKELDPNATGESAFGKLAGNDPDVEKVMKFLHDAESLDNSMSKGFYGRAQTGTALYKAIEQIPNFFARDSLFQSIQAEITTGETPRVYLVGSSFGATGASLLPNMAKTLRTYFTSKVSIGAVLMLPYFGYESASEDGRKALVSPETHWEKAREALNYYGDGNQMTIRLIGEGFGNPSVTLDCFYIVGCSPLTSINSHFADGGKDQNNNVHIAELYAAMGARHFFDLADQGDAGAPGAGTPATYAYSVGVGTQFTWARIDPRLREQFLRLIRFSVAALTYVHPLAYQKAPLEEDHTLRECFGVTSTGFFGSKKARVDKDVLKKNVKYVADFSKRFLDYITFLCYVGPDVALFDYEQYVHLFTKLQSFAPHPASRLRELTLNEAYSEQERQIINGLCLLKRINSNPTIQTKGANETDMGQLINEITHSMIQIKKAQPAPGSYAEHTINGMRKFYQSVYEFI